MFLFTAGLIVPAARRLRVNPVLGFLVIGIAVGPYGWAQLVPADSWTGYLTINNVDAAHSLAELGVVFLLFMIALELPLARLLAMRRLVFGLGFLQVAISVVVIGSIALAFGNSLQASLLIGGALALSSTAIVSQHLLDNRLMATRVGQSTFGVLLAQDLCVVPMLFLVGTIAATGAGADSSSYEIGASLLVAIGKAVAAIGGIIWVGRVVIGRVFRLVNVGHSSEVFMATTLLVITLIAWLTHAAGMSAALGAFLAGLILAETEYRHEIELIIEPLKGLLLGLFFLSVGMNINLAEVAANPGWIALSVAGLLSVKTLVAAGLTRLYGYNSSESVETGMLLSQGGEFAFVIVSGALVAGLVSDPVAQFMLIVVSATMAVTPGVIKLASVAGRASSAAPDIVALPEASAHTRPRVILVGYGRTGRLLSKLLEALGQEWLALDLDAVRVSEEQIAGQPVYLGDASRTALLLKFEVQDALAVVVCTDDARFSERILRSVRSVNSEVPVLMRVHSSEQGAEFIAAGASVAVPEVLESGLQLATSLFRTLRIDASTWEPLIGQQRSSQGLRRSGEDSSGDRGVNA